MGSTSITLGEVVAPTSPAETLPPASTTHGGVSTLESATGGVTALLSTAPCGGAAVRASSAKASPTTVSSGDLVREGEVRAPRLLYGSVIGLCSKTPRQVKHSQIASTKRLSLQEFTLYQPGCEASA
jgi:hypothetical protein